MVWYNLNVKRFAILTTSLIMAAVTVGGGVSAAAEESGTVYPGNGDFVKTLEFSDLTDYAVNDNSYAFAEDKSVYVCSDGTRTVYGFENTVTALDCNDGVFYLEDSTGKVYSLPYSDGQEQADYKMPEPETTITVGAYNYYLKDKSLKISDYEQDVIHTAEGEYRNLKLFGESVYAISENVVYSFTGEVATAVTISYEDFSATQTILTGQASKAFEDGYEPSFVEVTAGAYMTETDLTELDGKYFKTGETVTAKEHLTALLLCRTGNAAVIATGGKGYILLADNVKECTVKYSFTPEFKSATVLGDDIYAAPYVAMQPALTGAMNKVVDVESKIELNGVLDFVFYKVKYKTEDGTDKYGYVTAGLLSGIYISSDNDDPSHITDPDYTEQSDTRTVLLILAVVILLLAAVSYLVYVGTSGKRKKDKDKAKDAEEKP